MTSRPRPVARFVEREVRAYLACGVLAHGFLRVHCDGCGHDRRVAVRLSQALRSLILLSLMI